MDTKTVVIGGGLAGLTAALFLARGGKRVVLVEKSAEPGGRARSKQSKGFHLNLGPHALYVAGAACKILRELKIPFSGGIPAPRSAALVVDSNGNFSGIFQLPTNMQSFLTTGLFSVAEKLEFGKFYAWITRVRAEAWQSITLREWVEKNVKQIRVRQMVYALFRVTTYSNDPDNMSAGEAINQLQLALGENVYYLDQGWQSLVNGLRDAVEAAGVSVLSCRRAESLELNGPVKRVHLSRVTESDENVIDATEVVLAVPPAEVRRLIPEIDASVFPTRAIYAATLDLALTALPNPKIQFALGINRPLYFSVHSEWADLAPKGSALIHAATYLGSEAPEDADVVMRELEAMVDAIQPGWRRLLIHRRFLPGLIVSHALPMAHAAGSTSRPSIDALGVPGIYIAGDWVGNEGMLTDAAIASAKAAALAILRTNVADAVELGSPPLFRGELVGG